MGIMCFPGKLMRNPVPVAALENDFTSLALVLTTRSFLLTNWTFQTTKYVFTYLRRLINSTTTSPRRTPRSDSLVRQQLCFILNTP